MDNFDPQDNATACSDMRTCEPIKGARIRDPRIGAVNAIEKLGCCCKKLKNSSGSDLDGNSP
eukprot:238802-Pleurochrysis_carterae.AAC.1